MRTDRKLPLLISHSLLLVLVLVIAFAQKQRPTVRSPLALLAGIALMELLFLHRLYRANTRAAGQSAVNMICFVWLLLLCWELWASVLNLAHPVLVPAPENVFDTFREQWRQMLLNVIHSMELWAAGFSGGMLMGVILGLFAGWRQELRNFIYPIANVMAPIPAIVFSPYLVAIMPSFRSASILVILLGVFWPCLLTTINRVVSMDERILDSARMLNLSDWEMVWKILLPYVFPGVIMGLKVSVTTSLLMLNFAELMGASHGMGYYIQNSITYANYTHAIAGIICVGVVVTLINKLVVLVQKKCICWH